MVLSILKMVHAHPARGSSKDNRLHGTFGGSLSAAALVVLLPQRLGDSSLEFLLLSHRQSGFGFWAQA